MEDRERDDGGDRRGPYDTAVRIAAWAYEADVRYEIEGKFFTETGRDLSTVTVAQFLKMAVAHIFSMGGAMSNPFEFREVMKAQFQLNTDKTVDQVLAEQEQRHAAVKPTRSRRGGAATPAPPPAHGTIPRGELAKLRQMLGPPKALPPGTEG